MTLTDGDVYVTVPTKQIGVGLLGVILRDCNIDREKFFESL